MVLAGCVADPDSTAPRPSSATPSASVAPSPTPLPATPADGLWASGSFASPAAGDVTITGENGSTSKGIVEIAGLSGVRGANAGVQLVAASGVIANGCLTGHALDIGTAALGTSLQSPAFSLAEPDPTQWRRIVLTDTSDPSCVRILASADLTWRVAPFRPRLEAITDTGAARGAMGPVSQVGGAVYSYQVVRGDNLRAIGNRFGIGESDLRYLNPFRAWTSPDAIYADEVLNLSLDAR